MISNAKRTRTRMTGVSMLITLLLGFSLASQAGALQSSPFKAPAANDVTFVVDDSSGLDTGCTFRSGGPLVFDIPVTRFIGDVQKLLAGGAIKTTATLRMPAFDVDFAGAPGFPPERDRVLFNGEVVDGEFLTGANNVWKLNAFTIPVEKIKFPQDPGEGGQIEPAMNRVEIQIDVLSAPAENWCTAIDWAALTIKVARPNLLVHGIFSEGATWSPVWTSGLDELGIPAATIDMGRLDSIGANAGKIAAKISALKKRWGVDALDVVAHSKGGIDSRHHIEGSEDVARLIQIGTPNAGSPLADYIQAGAYLFLGPALSRVANGLAGGAGGYQLTTLYMTLYNAFHGFNTEVDYLSVGGIYSGGGIVDNVLNAILPGKDDTIVPLSSVHALPYSQPFEFESSGTDRQASHTGQTGSSGIFGDLLPITAIPQGKSPFVQAAQVLQIVPVPTEILTGTLHQGEVQTRTIPVDSAGAGTFVMFYGTGNLDMALISPSGVRVDPASVPGFPGVRFEANEGTEGFKSEAYRFDSLEAGAWTVVITGGAMPNPPGAETYFVSAWLGASTISLVVASREPSYSAGQQMVIEVTLRNGATPILNANVTAAVRLPDDTFVNIVLQDSGAGADQVANDGIYTGLLSQTTQAGVYQVGITASSASPGFSRSGFVVVPVSASTSHLTGTITDQGVDTNQNGLFEQLAIDVQIAVTQQASYVMLGQLETDSGQLLGSVTVRKALAPGMSTVRLAFDGQAIFRQGVDGPYRLKLLRLAEETLAGDVLPLGAQEDVYHTAAYSFRNFERDAIFLSGAGQDDGADTNGNGLFDVLNVSLNVDLLVAGQYQWTARLVDRKGAEIGFASNAGFLPAGAAFLTLVFDGKVIGKNGVDGPYSVVDLLVFGSGESQVVFDAYTTKAYVVQQFEGAGASLLALSPAHLWIGLRNSDDQGTQFDLKVELLKNGTPVASGLKRCVTGVTRNPSFAKEGVVPFDSVNPVPVVSGDVLSVRISTRIGTKPDNTKCAGHNSAVGLRLYYDSTSRPSRFDATITPNSSKDLYLDSDGGVCPGGGGQSTGVTRRFLDTTAPTATSAKCKDSGSVNFAAGNPFAVIGTWSLAPLP